MFAKDNSGLKTNLEISSTEFCQSIFENAKFWEIFNQEVYSFFFNTYQWYKDALMLLKFFCSTLNRIQFYTSTSFAFSKLFQSGQNELGCQTKTGYIV